jgi:nucleotidyltransferase/DNA polymerase involved in DNA repair
VEFLGSFHDTLSDNPSEEIAKEIKKRIKEETNLNCSIFNSINATIDTPSPRGYWQ